MKPSNQIRQMAERLASTAPAEAYDLIGLADSLDAQEAFGLPDFWMDRQAVAEFCPECADKMASLNIRQIKASAFFGSDQAKLKMAKKWQGLPKGWTDESLKKFWSSLTGNAKHKVTQCMKKMEGKVDDPGAFCASAKDRIEGTSKWRGREAADFNQLKSLIIRTAASDAHAKRVLMPILQALKGMESTK